MKSKRICPKCKKKRFLTKHHITPIKVIYLCRTCHDKEHGITTYKTKINKKYQKGTKKQHKK